MIKVIDSSFTYSTYQTTITFKYSGSDYIIITARSSTPSVIERNPGVAYSRRGTIKVNKIKNVIDPPLFFSVGIHISGWAMILTKSH